MYSMYFPREANTHCHDLPFEKRYCLHLPCHPQGKWVYFQTVHCMKGTKCKENLNGLLGFPRAFGNHKVCMRTGPSKYLQSSKVVKKPQAQSESLKSFFVNPSRLYQGLGKSLYVSNTSPNVIHVCTMYCNNM